MLTYALTSTNKAAPDLDLTSYPAISQTSPSPDVSARYRFISTTRVLSVLRDYGFEPAAAIEAPARKAERRGYQRHMVRLNNYRLNADADAGTTLAQILLENCHSGAGAFIFRMGLYEKICRNGMVVPTDDSMPELRVTHKGYADSLVEDAIRAIVGVLPGTLESVHAAKRVTLTDREREAFATEAASLRWDLGQYRVRTEDLLAPRHGEQRSPTLWNTFNVVQEALVRGGVPLINGRTGKHRRSCAIRGIRADVKLNESLYALMADTLRCHR